MIEALPAGGAGADYLQALRTPAEDGSWRPLAGIGLSAQKGAVAPDQTTPFRAVNLILLALTALAAYAFMRQPAMGTRRVPAFLAALILVAHPAASTLIYHVCDGREILQGLLLMVMGLIFYIRGGWLGAIGAAVAYALALGTTEQALWLPAALAVAEGVGLAGWRGLESDIGRTSVSQLKVISKKETHARQWKRLIPVLLVGVLYLGWRWTILGKLVSADSVPARAPFTEWLYGWMALAMPRRIVVFQPGLSLGQMGMGLLPAALLMGVVLGLVVLAFRLSGAMAPQRRREEGRRVWMWMALMICFFPALTGVLDGRIPFDEGRQFPFFLPILGLLAWAVSRFWRMEMVRLEAMVAGIAVAVILGAVSMGRRDYYKNDAAFVSHWVRVNPLAWKNLALRAEAWADAGRYASAEKQVERGLMLKPEEPALLEVRAFIQEKTGRWSEALSTLGHLEAGDPTNLAFRVRAADVHFKAGQFKEAEALYASLLEAMPEDAALKEKSEAAKKAAEQP